MRIDKYLWCTRYFKTRNQASIACKKGSVRVNEATVKPSREIYPGDQISVRKNQINYTLEILEIPPSRVGAKLVGLYRTDTTPASAFENTELLKYAKDYYRKKGTGRPTKKDRRDLEDFTEDTTE
ncbi:MAG: RNA-binding S4 domain-containing protein [Flavobacteriaceae bacterium]|nr:RNA-binding S4 domain-containing protein [Flavobacteriaceae bacterium]